MNFLPLLDIFVIFNVGWEACLFRQAGNWNKYIESKKSPAEKGIPILLAVCFIFIVITDIMGIK